ncbi:BREX-1 system adenine-specific DNA-methyltransferase PglX [Segatella copri]|uniref:BREX-1 system adenine-specific DNA-methyltransferase PglX n=1 Tax=Segatella copri TaxID=165179 RepID=UPI002FF41DE0
MNTSALKTFAQETRKKLVSSIKTRMNYILTEDTAELRGKQNEINTLRKEIAAKGENNVVEEVTYTWFNRVMALRFMDANGYNVPMVITPAAGQIRPEILQEAMGGNIDEDLGISLDILRKDEEEIYHKLLIAICRQYNNPMPFLFESISDYTELLLPTDLLSEQSFVTDIRKGMTDEDCQNVEIMGWLYQFYITERKADAEAKKSQKGGLKSDEQAAATQLFTPHWIVRYMVENTLGRIWTTLHPDTALKAEMPYYIEPADNQPDPIPEDIQSVKDIRFIDPCMGSGHVLVYAFDLLCKMYEEEGYRTKEIPALILENNLYGMDIDKRCYQLASFALTMKANAYYSRYLRRKPVEPNVIFLENIDHETIAASSNWDEKSLMWQFENIDTIGSLLKVTKEEYEAIQVGNNLFGENAKMLKREAEYLSRGYHCVVTNPPYLGKGFCDVLKAYVQKEYPNSKADTMATFMERCMEYCTPKGKMAMINMQSWMFLSSFEKLRKDIIEHYQIDSLLHLGAHTFDELNGEVVQNAAFVILKDSLQKSTTTQFYRLINGRNSSTKESEFLANRQNSQKNNIYYPKVKQADFEMIPGSSFGYWLSQQLFNIFANSKSINTYADPRQGLATGDNNRFLRLWFEVSKAKSKFNETGYQEAINSGFKWFPCTKGGGFRRWYGNKNYIIAFDNENYEALSNSGNHLPSKEYYFLKGLSWSTISNDNIAFRYTTNSIFETKGSICFPRTNTNIYILSAYLNSIVVQKMLSVISPTLDYHEGPLRKVPCKVLDQNEIEIIAKQNISISKSDWDAHETSWEFTSNELLSIDLDSYESIMHGYADYHQISIDLEPAELNKLSWRVDIYKKKWETMFLRLHQNEEELNEKFIHIYGLEDELTPDVPLDEVTILQQGEISIEKEKTEDGSKEEEKIIWHDDVIIKQFISYLVGCFMGRFSVDKPGLIIANQHQDLSNLNLQVDGIENSPRSTLSIDDDGIVPIIQESDFFADDMTERIQLAIKTLFGEEQYYENMKYIEQTIGKPLRDYLYKDYYADHQQMYSVKGAKRPIYWLFSSRMGDKHKKGYFKALVYMHRMEADTLSKLHADYVHPYINKVEQQLREAEEETLRDDLTQAQRNRALKLVNELKEKVKEVKEFEQELVEMASHRLTIDLDDGVKVNYPKFYPLVEPIKGLECEKK